MSEKPELIDRNEFLEVLKTIDVKKLTYLDHKDPEYVKAFRFGNYNAIKAMAQIVALMPLKNQRKKKDA